MSPMRVLLATDGSEEAIAARDWLLTFPLPTSGTVRVLAVATLPPTPPPELVTLTEYRRARTADRPRAAGRARHPLGCRRGTRDGGRRARGDRADGRGMAGRPRRGRRARPDAAQEALETVTVITT